jgi:hypothetical protein
MRQSSHPRGSRAAVWAERGQDAVLVSTFMFWAAILGLGPVFAVRALLLP